MAVERFTVLELDQHGVALRCVEEAEGQLGAAAVSQSTRRRKRLGDRRRTMFSGRYVPSCGWNGGRAEFVGRVAHVWAAFGGDAASRFECLEFVEPGIMQPCLRLRGSSPIPAPHTHGPMARVSQWGDSRISTAAPTILTPHRWNDEQVDATTLEHCELPQP